MKKMKGKREKEDSFENISDIIAKSCKIEPFFDPALVAMFAPRPRATPVVPSNPSPIPPKAERNEKGKTSDAQASKSKPEVKLSHRDAAAIRIEAKLKSKLSQQKVDESEVAKKKTKSKSKKRNVGGLDGEQESVAVEESGPPKKLKCKKRKAESPDASDGEEQDKETSTKRRKQMVKATNSEDEEESESKSTPVNKSHQELNAPKEKDAELEHRTVFVGNVPKDVKKSKLRQIFSQYGAIETIRFRGAAPAKPTLLKKVALRKNELHPDSASIVSYIRYKTRKEAKKTSRKLNGYQMGEHYLTVDLADNKKRDNKKAIFVGNLHLKLQDDELRSFFGQCGSINAVRIVRDRETGMGKGFGYVNFESSDSVELGLKLDGGELRNRPIRVKRAVKKEKVKRGQQPHAAAGGHQRANGNRPSIPHPNKSPQQTHTPRRPTEFTVRPPPRKEAFSGDRLSEIGKLKRKQKKPNRGEMKKARIVQQLTGVKSKEVFQKKKARHRHLKN